ncbi:aspartic peptidase domain-containing protein [Phyllosticta citrichinensis]|uniref:Aspartic peptidase domain-containing protein n=1 Tax=Phyllosticta citrichinensis TaxID=1130410 RepID=A0ABR1XKM4_9PEZI
MMDRVLTFAIILGCAVAAPHELTDGTFTSTQVARGYMLRNGPIQMANAYNKFGGTMPADVEAASGKAFAKLAASGSSSRLFVRDVAAVSEDDYDTLYLSPVTVGSSVMQLIFDTGSSDLWVFSNLMPVSQQLGQHLYNPTVSGRLIPGSWSITYGDGSAGAGQVYADRVAVGEVTATAQAVEAATSASSLFLQDTASDGVLGLAASALNSVRPTKQQTFLDTAKIKLFTANLRKTVPGTYTFGFINSSLYTGPITYTPVAPANRQQTGFWSFNITGYSVGRGAVTTKPISAIADTGTSLAYLPQDVAAAFYNQIPGASYSVTYGGFILPCSATPPTFNFQVSGVLQTIPGSYLVYGPVDYDGNCFGGLQSSAGMPFNVIGAIVLKSQFVVFDNSTSPARIGWAKQPGVVYS